MLSQTLWPTEFLLETFQGPTPKCVKNEIRDFETKTTIYHKKLP